jgi:hypothetical protein
MPPRRRAAATAASPSGPRRPQAITNLQASDRISRRKWWIHGDSGIGKTVLAGSAPKALFLTTDVEGTESAKEFGSTADEVVITSWEQFVETNAWLVHPNGGVNEYEWIILDTVDELEELCWAAQLVSTDVKRASKYQPNKADYPLVWSKIKEQIMLLNRSSINCLYLSHSMRIDRETDDGEDTQTLAMPSIGSRKRGDLSTYLCAQMTLVGYMRRVANEDGKAVRQVLTEAGPRWIAKDRHNAFGPGVTDPTIPNMLAAIAAKPSTTPARSAPGATRRRRARG